MQTLKRKPPPRLAGASESVHAGSNDIHIDSPKSSEKQASQRKRRLAALYPHCDPQTLELRAELAAAESILLASLQYLDHAPEALVQTASLAIRLAGRASRSAWPKADLKAALRTVKCSYFACTGLAQFMDKYDE